MRRPPAAKGDEHGMVFQKCTPVVKISGWIRAAGILAVLALICACQATRPATEPAGGSDASAAPSPRGAFQPSPNHYYYFLRSRLAAGAGRMEQAVAFMERAVEAAPGEPFLKKELALMYMNQAEAEKAVDLVEAVLEANPGDAEAWIVAGTLRQRAGDTAAAIEAYEKAAKIAPERKNLHLVLARLYLQENAHEKAVGLLESFTERFPENATGYYYLGKAYAGMNLPEKAVAAYEKCLAADAGLVEPRLEMIDIYTDRKETDKVVELYREILARHPKNVPAAIELGLLYEKQGDTDSAERLWRELGKRVSSDDGVIRAVTRHLLSRQRYKDALTVLSGMLRTDAGNSALHYLAGATRYLMDQPEAALAHFQQVRAGSGFYPDAVIHQAIIHNRRGNTQKAVALLEAAMDDVGDAAKVSLIPYLSAFYQEQKHFREAAALLKKGLALEPENADLHYELGVLYDKMGDAAGAIKKMKQVIDMDPKHADALNYLGYTYADKGIHLEEAESLIRRALEVEGDNGYILDSMGWVYYRQGEYEKARQFMEKAVERVPDDPVILEHAGDVYIKLQQPEKAIQYYRRALENAPANKAALGEKIEAARQAEVQP